MAKRPDKANGETLNAQQRQFCAEYVVDFNGAAAARRAGYSHDSARIIASTLLTKPNIKATITELLKERADGPLITVAEVVTGLKQVKDRCLSDDEFDPAGANRSLELLGKYLRMWVERSEVVDVTSAKQFAADVLGIVMRRVADPKVRETIVADIEALCRA